MARIGPGSRPLHMDFKLEGADAVMAKLKATEKELTKAVEAGLFAVAQQVMTEAKTEAPMDLGTLRASGFVALPVNGVVQLGFGGAAGAYAVVQHERMDFKHTHGKAHYLKDPLDRARAWALVRVKDVVEFSIGRFAINARAFALHPTAPRGGMGRAGGWRTKRNKRRR